MNEMNIANVDLNLLKTLNVLLKEKHVGRSAEVLHISQSAVSHSLSRLRQTFDDPLFIRTSKGLEPTAYALKLAPRVEFVLSEIKSIFAPKVFEPEIVSGVFRIQTHDFVAEAYLLPQIQRLRLKAPNLVFEIKTVQENSYEQLDSGKADLFIGAGVKAPTRFMQRRVCEDEIVCLIRNDHPALENWTVETVLGYPNIKLTLLPQQEDPIDCYIKENQLPKRNVGMYCDNLHLQPAMIEGSNIVGFVPEKLASISCQKYDLFYKSSPFPLPGVVIKQIWHERNQQDELHKWIRTELADSGEQV